MKLKDRMTGKVVEVNSHELLDSLPSDRDGALEMLESRVRSLTEVVAILIDSLPEARKKVISLHWRYER